MSSKVTIIGSGFSGLSAACYLAQKGFEVTVLEKNSKPGGRAGQLSDSGFIFDTGPSWYWMPEVFDHFFEDFGKKREEYYEIERLNPSYKFYFGKGDEKVITSDLKSIKKVYDEYEQDGGAKLEEYLKDAGRKYRIAMGSFIQKPGISIKEYLSFKLLLQSVKMNMFKPLERHLDSHFQSKRIKLMLEFPVLFLGGSARNIPAMYSLMNYADIMGGTWYPKGGMYSVVTSLVELALSLGVKFSFNSEVTGFEFQGNKIRFVNTKDSRFETDYVVAAADYQHVEQKLLPFQFRMYSNKYWETRTLSPSSLLYMIGVDKKISGLEHHTLFFDEDLRTHAHSIYEEPEWPHAPAIYLSCTSKTDADAAPDGMENIFALIPVASGLSDTPEIREQYFNLIIDKIEFLTGEKLRGHIVLKKSYAQSDFINDYNAYKGNAYGLANTLLQTAFLKPKMKSNKVSNLYFSGQLTVPGPGVPPAIISGKITSTLVEKAELKRK